MTKTWRCTICGYLHRGDTPPESCPNCDAPAASFVLVREGAFGFLMELYDTFLLHAVASHFPNALLPTTLFLTIMAMAIGSVCLEQSSLLLLVLALVSVPVSFASGFYDWRTRYGGVAAPIFYRKIVCAAILFGLGIAAVLIRLARPAVLASGGWLAAVYLACLFFMLAMVVLLGHYGGKLVFQWKATKGV